MKDRLIASSIHLFISLLAALLILALLFLLWFPSPLMSLGAVQGVQLILLVDLVIGPLLTLLVFKKGKPSLVFDMSVIVALQLAALTYGLTTVYGQIPSHLVLTHEGMHVVSRYDVKTYLEPKDYSIVESLLESPVEYAGSIPVFLLKENTNSEQRQQDNFIYLFNESMPYYLNTEDYQAFENFDYLVTSGSVATQEHSTGNTCFEITLLSVHGSADTCLYRDGQSIIFLD